MYDAASPSDTDADRLGMPPLGMQRARGSLRVGFGLRDGKTVLRDLRQEGCLKARFPRRERGAWTGVVMLNSSGGVAGGDVLSTGITVAEGAAATVAAQAAERFYRAVPDQPPARLRNSVTLAAGAAGEWLPQETILFDRCALDRRLDVSIAADAWFLGVEALIFGRAGMGETVRHARLHDTITLCREGVPVLRDAIRMEGSVATLLSRAAVAHGGAAIATIVHAAPDAEGHLEAVRAATAGCAAECGASAWDGMLVARIVARDGAELRAATVACLAPLRAARPLPRVWHC